MIDDKPCPRCRSLDRDAERCLACGLTYWHSRWWLPDNGGEYTDKRDDEVRRSGWSNLRRMQGQRDISRESGGEEG